MSEPKNNIAQRLADAMRNNLTEERKRELERWKEFATKNKLIENITVKDRVYAGNSIGAPPSLALKILLAFLVAIILSGVITIVYLSISNAKNDRFPLKSGQQRLFRL